MSVTYVDPAPPSLRGNGNTDSTGFTQTSHVNVVVQCAPFSDSFTQQNVIDAHRCYCMS